MPVMAIALDRLPASFANGVFKRRNSLLLRCGGAGHVENFFLEDCSMEIVHTIAQRNLCERQSEAHPICRQVVDVIEVNTAHREIAQLLKCGGALGVGKYSVRLRWLECKRNKPRKAAGFILQLPQLAQMVSPMRKRFYLSVKHRACAAAAHRMPGAMNVQPFGGGFFAAANLIAHDWVEDFGASAGDRTKPRFAQNFQRIANRHFEDSLGQMANFDRGECLYMQLRIECA